MGMDENTLYNATMQMTWNVMYHDNRNHSELSGAQDIVA
jgi:hypothetical protein